MRTVPEKTLRNWKTGAGTGSGRTQAKRSNEIQTKKHITVDTMQGNEKGFPVFMCCYLEQHKVYRGEECRHESIADKLTERFNNRK